jgi:hypothetical protein
MLSSTTGSESLGKIIVDVQNQVASIKKQLATISNDKFVHQYSYVKLQDELNEIENRNKKRAEQLMLSSPKQDDLTNLNSLQLPKLKELKSLSLNSHFKASTSLPSPNNKSCRKYKSTTFEQESPGKAHNRKHYLFRQYSVQLPKIDSVRYTGKYPLNGKLISSKCIYLI